MWLRVEGKRGRGCVEGEGDEGYMCGMREPDLGLRVEG